jgi:hypothetical protein
VISVIEDDNCSAAAATVCTFADVSCGIRHGLGDALNAGFETVGEASHRGPLLGFRIALHALLFAAQARHLDGILPEHIHRLRHPADFVAAFAIRQFDLVGTVRELAHRFGDGQDRTRNAA